MWPRLQNQPVQTLYWLVNQFVPPEDWKHGSPPGNTLLVQFDWRSREKILYGLFLEQSSPNKPFDSKKESEVAKKPRKRVRIGLNPAGFRGGRDFADFRARK